MFHDCSVSGDDEFPLTKDFSQGEWTSYVPPHGVRYCYNHVDQVVTPHDITNPNNLIRVKVDTETTNTVIANSNSKDELQRAPNRDLFICKHLESFRACVLDHNRRSVLHVFTGRTRIRIKDCDPPK